MQLILRAFIEPICRYLSLSQPSQRLRNVSVAFFLIGPKQASKHLDRPFTHAVESPSLPISRTVVLFPSSTSIRFDDLDQGPPNKASAPAALIHSDRNHEIRIARPYEHWMGLLASIP